MKLPFFKVCLRIVVFQLGVLLCQTASAAVNFTVTPLAVGNTYTGTITLQVTGLASGDTVMVQRFLDGNADGIIDAGDILWEQFNLTDGQGGMVIGGVTNINVPGDTDTAAGQITAKLTMARNFNPPIAGNYLFKLSSPAGHFTPKTNSFAITNFAYGQAFAGTVVSNGVAVPNAAVILLQSSGGNNLNPVAGAVANNSGNYTIEAAPGTYSLLAFKSNFVANTAAAANLVLASGVTNSTNVSVMAATQTISGQIIDANNSSIGLPGLLLSVQTKDGLFGLSFTDTNGYFSAGVTVDTWKLGGDSAGIAVLGYLDSQNKTNVTIAGANVSNVTIALPKATALFYGTVEDNSGNPFPGVDIYTSDDNGMYQSDGYSDLNGNYVITALGGLGSNDLWYVSVDNSSSFPNDNFSQPSFDQFGGTNLAVGEAVAANFSSILATNYISGNVEFNGGPVSNAQVNASSQDGNNYQSQAITDNSGNYSMNVGIGNWYVNINCQGGDNSLDQIFGSGNYVCPCGTNVTVNSSNVTASFVVVASGSGQIFGFVSGTSGNPLVGVSVSATGCMGGDYSVLTGQNGYYSINIPNGTWDVHVDCGDLSAINYQCVSDQYVTVAGQGIEQSFVVPPVVSSNMPPALGSAEKSGGQFQFLINGSSGQNYTVQSSTNLNSTNWITLYTTNNATTSSILITDFNATNKQGFYRILLGQ